MTVPFPPIRGGTYVEGRALTPEEAEKAVELVREALPFFRAGEPIIHPDHIDVPVFYLDFAVDRVHYDGDSGGPAPKGAPPHEPVAVKPEEARERIEDALKEARVIDAAEFRGPEDCWAVPVAWKSFIILHVRVSRRGAELIPDYGLTEEARRHGTL